MMKPTLLLRLYSLLMRIAAPLLPLYLKSRVKKGKEDSTRLAERYARPSRPRPDGPLIWFHGASVGETLMVISIINHLLDKNPSLNILVTSGTVTSAELLSSRLVGRAFHQYLPADVPAYAKRFIDHWQPDLCLWLESDIWPNLLRATKARNTPTLLLNARFSESSQAGWMKRPKTAKALFATFDDILPADDEATAFLSKVLDRDLETFGNLKMAAARLPFDNNDVKHIHAHINSRYHNWCAASTHDGEDEIIIEAHIAVLKHIPDASLILVPRHPERADEIIKLLEARKLSYARWGAPPSEKSSVLLVDQIGKMGAVYSASRIVLMGGSLLPHLKGHNPLEPAHFNCGIIHGPHVSSFLPVYDNMNNIKAAVRLEDTGANNIAEQVKIWLEYDGNLGRRAKKAKKFTTLKEHQVMAKVTAHLVPFISALSQLD